MISEELDKKVAEIEKQLKAGKKKYNGCDITYGEKDNLYVFKFNNSSPYRLYVHGRDILSGEYKKVMNGWL